MVSLVGLLAVGLVVNVCVAWTFAVLPSKDKSSIWQAANAAGRKGIPIGKWPLRVPSGDIDYVEMEAIEWSEFGVTLHSCAMQLPSAVHISQVVASEVGFPARSLVHLYVYGLDSKLDPTSRYAKPLEIPWPSRKNPPIGKVLLPLAPLWPGFALNTIFYAALAWGLWHVPLAIRRRRRRRNGLCVRCGYDLKGLASGSPCPECGGPP